MDERNSDGLPRPVLPRGPFPYIIARIMAGSMHRLPVTVCFGPPGAHVGYRSSYVQHPVPYRDGALCSEARWLLIKATQEAVGRSGFDMCVVWAPDSATFCWRDGSVTHSAEPPIDGADGGMSMTDACSALAAKGEGVEQARPSRDDAGSRSTVAYACTAGGGEGERCQVVHVPLFGPASQPDDRGAFLQRFFNDQQVIARLTPRERALLEGRLPLASEDEEDPAHWVWWHCVKSEAETVLAVSWDGHAPGMSGAIFHCCWRGLFFAESYDTEPAGPFGTLDEALSAAGPETFRGMHEVSSNTLREDDLLALVHRRLDPDADNVTVNEVRYVLKNGQLTPDEAE